MPALLILPGLGTPARVWTSVADRLWHELDIEILDLDAVSGWYDPAEDPPTLERIAEDVWSSVETWAPTDDLHVLGHSLGGSVAFAMATARPGSVRSLTLVAPTLFVKSPLLDALDLMTRGREESSLSQTVAAYSIAISAAFQENRLAAAVSAAEKSVEKSVEKPTEKSEKERLPPGKLPNLQVLKLALRTRDELPADAAHRPLGTLIPVQVIWGDRDRITPVSGIDKARTIIGPAVYRIIQGAQHAPHVSDQSELCWFVDEFIRGQYGELDRVTGSGEESGA